MSGPSSVIGLPYPCNGRPKTISTSSRPSIASASASNHLRSDQSKPNTPAPRVSTVISGGADRIVALIEEENARIDAQNKEQLKDLEARFEEYRNHAAREHQYMMDRIRVLEADLAMKRGSTMENIDALCNCKPAIQSTLDMETTRLVSELARLANLADQSPDQKGETLDIHQLPDLFLPALSQYLASHKKAIQELEEKHRATEKERDDLVIFKTVLLSQIRTMKNDFEASCIPSSTT
ncbi:hypothetical protein H0H87_009464 [Tephrocybe sp. NHM501043]|nr:hypothetical protein H0H87_009464 [Tephrocybe sp. NHM501043]